MKSTAIIYRLTDTKAFARRVAAREAINAITTREQSGRCSGSNCDIVRLDFGKGAHLPAAPKNELGKRPLKEHQTYRTKPASHDEPEREQCPELPTVHSALLPIGMVLDRALTGLGIDWYRYVEGETERPAEQHARHAGGDEEDGDERNSGDGHLPALVSEADAHGREDDERGDDGDEGDGDHGHT